MWKTRKVYNNNNNNNNNNNSNNNNKTCQKVAFAIPTDHWVTIKEKEKRDKYLDLPRELKTQTNLKVIMILIVISVLGTIPNGLERRRSGIRERAETIQTTALLSYWEESWRPEETWYLSDSSERPSANTGVKNSQGAMISK